MSPVEWQQLGEDMVTISKAMLVGAFLAGMLGRSFGHLVVDLVRWAMRRVPSWRRWERATNRMERLEHAEWLRVRREQIDWRELALQAVDAPTEAAFFAVRERIAQRAAKVKP